MFDDNTVRMGMIQIQCCIATSNASKAYSTHKNGKSTYQKLNDSLRRKLTVSKCGLKEDDEVCYILYCIVFVFYSPGLRCGAERYRLSTD